MDNTADTQGFFGRCNSRFGDIAKRLKLIDDDDLQHAVQTQESLKKENAPHEKIGRILMNMGKLTPECVKNVLKTQENLNTDSDEILQ